MRNCRVVDVVDGDTVTVEIVTRARVRMVGCWAPELRDANPVQRGLAQQARDHLVALVSERREGEVFISLDGVDRLDDTVSFGRVLGAVYLGDDKKSLSEQMVAAGLASTTKDGELGR